VSLTSSVPPRKDRERASSGKMPLPIMINQPLRPVRLGMSFERAGPCSTIVATLDTGEVLRGCGFSWCDGRCEQPALTATLDGKELRVFGSMVAIGSVLQEFRLPWVGTKLPLPAAAAEHLRGKLWL
jgi:hypothetical protein